MNDKSTAYLIGRITIKDHEKWAEYRSKVGATIAPWGGEIICRGKWVSTLCGKHDHANALVMRFPDSDAVKKWYGSAAYQTLIPIREQAADMILEIYEAVSYPQS